MKLTRMAAAAALAATAVFGVAAPALGQSYDDNEPAGVSDSTVTPGQSFQADSGSGSYNPGESVEVRVLGANFDQVCQASATADSTGNVEATCTVPSNARPGRARVLFTSLVNGDEVTVPFTVVSGAAASPGRGQLPRTGADHVAELTAAGIGLVVFGAGLVAVARRRREQAPAGLA